jgi:hypothetical protein
MPIVPLLPADNPLLRLDSASIPAYYAMTSERRLPVPSPVGEPKFGLRLGFSEAETPSYFGGIDLTVPVSTGVRLFALRADADYWRHTNSSHGKNAGGDALSICGLLGPSSSYFGVGLTDASRYGGASGPQGAGLKLLFGSRILPVVGYELEAITTSKGSMAAAMATFHL